MKLNHKQKVAMAKKMLSPLERVLKVPIFLSSAWNQRNKQKLDKEIKKHEKAINKKKGQKSE